MSLRYQPPVHSPLSLGALAGAAVRPFSQGDPRDALAALLRRGYGADAVLLTGSGTQALQGAIRGAASLAGGAHVVALPAFCCYDVATAAVGAGLDIALYDVDPVSLAPDLASLERALQEGSRVVVACPLFGIPFDWDAVDHLADSYGAVAVEDAAQGHGASWRGTALGSIGRLSVLSFGRGKGWTGSRGGALLFRGGGSGRPMAEPAAGFAHSSALVGTALAQWLLARPSLYGIPAALPFLGLGETHYREPGPMQEMAVTAAALALRTREAALREAEARRAAGAFWTEQLRSGDGIEPILVPSEAQAGWLRFPVRVAGGMRGVSREALALGVARTYPTTLAEVAAVRERLRNPGERWPGALELVRTLVTLPTHSRVTLPERQRLARLMDRAGDGSPLTSHVAQPAA